MFSYPPTRRLAFGEFITLMALMTPLVALTIDAMLPALQEIGTELASANANDNQLIISPMFLGGSLSLLLIGYGQLKVALRLI